MVTSSPSVPLPAAEGKGRADSGVSFRAMRNEARGSALWATRWRATSRGTSCPFWAREAVDEEHGGFLGFLSEAGVPDPLAPKGGVLCARILWTYSAALRRTGDPGHRRMADRAFDELRGRFWDAEHGGTYWMLDGSGRPLSDRKQTYALAFSLYGLAEYHRATGSAAALERAVELHRAIEAHASDPAHGGYWEARARDWGPLADVRLSEKDQNAPKSMNTHLHVMEGYANLLRAWDDPGLRERLRALVELHLDRILDPATGHLLLFFDERWAPVSRMISYGHDIEASWLLVEAAEAAGDRALVERAKAAAVRLARVDPRRGRGRGARRGVRGAARGRASRRREALVDAGGGGGGLPERLRAHAGGAVPRRGGAGLGLRRALPDRPRPRRVALAGAARRHADPGAAQGGALEVPVPQLPRRLRSDRPRRPPHPLTRHSEGASC